MGIGGHFIRRASGDSARIGRGGLSSGKLAQGEGGRKNGIAAARSCPAPAISPANIGTFRIFSLAGKSFGNRQVLIFWQPEISLDRS
jgi:hypothetical protein